MPYGVAGFGRVGAKRVSRMIHVGVVKRDEVRPLRWRQAQPRQNLLHALLVRKFIIVGQVIAGAFSLNFGF